MENQPNQIIESYKQFWTRFLDVNGRSDRADYWHPFWINFLISTVLGALSGGLLSSIFAIAIIIPSFTVMVRRLHDTNRTILFAIISYISGFIASVGTLVFFFGVVLAANASEGWVLGATAFAGVFGIVVAGLVTLYIIYLLVLPGDKAPNNYGDGGSSKAVSNNPLAQDVEVE